MADNKVKGKSRGGRFGGGGPTEKAKDFKGTVKKLAGELFTFKFSLAIVLFFSIASTIFFIVSPKILGGAITILFEGLVAKAKGIGGVDFDKIGTIIILLLAFYVLSSIFSGIQGYVMATVVQKVCRDLRRRMSEKIDRMPFAYFEKNAVGDTLSRVTNDVDTIGNGLAQGLTQFISNSLMIVGILTMMLTINLLMTGVILLILPISALLMSVIVKKSQKYFREQQASLGKINGQVEETITGQDVVRIYSYEARAKADFEETNRTLYSSAWKSQFLSGVIFPLMQFVGNLGYVAVALLGGALAFNGTIPVGDIQAFIQYVRNFTMPIGQMAQIINMLQSTAAAAERIFNFLSEDEEPSDENAPIPVFNYRDVRGQVDIENIRFGYVPEKEIIHGFSLHVDQGKMVAIVGPTGGGKTTLVKLLMRFYDVSGGEIRVDTEKIQDIKRDELRHCFGMVLQDTWLFSGTIMENIRYGKLDASDEEVIKAAKAAGADHFIRTHPDGYAFKLNEEADNVSAGQKQLLTIARAILANRPILILDEATSSVDTRTETVIQKAVEKLMKNRTSFVIAHRLSTIKNADIILALDDGNIVEQGRHEELLAKGGYYAKLYNAQFEA
jgi:ATP-binding cassette subfamily B protein